MTRRATREPLHTSGTPYTLLIITTSSFHLKIGPQSEIEFWESRSHFQVD
jgi:hypothetical protein